jgi:hypothetical protein
MNAEIMMLAITLIIGFSLFFMVVTKKGSLNKAFYRFPKEDSLFNRVKGVAQR